MNNNAVETILNSEHEIKRCLKYGRFDARVSSLTASPVRLDEVVGDGNYQAAA